MYAEQFCLCYLDPAVAKKEEKKVVPTPLYNNCVEKLSTYDLKFQEVEEKYLNFVQFLKEEDLFDEKIVDVEGKKFAFCNKSQINAWFRKYKNEQKDSIDSLIAKVEKEFCDLKENEKSTNNHKKCYKALIERSDKPDAEASCLSERDNQNKKIHENCIEMAQATQVLSTHDDKYSNSEEKGSLKYKMEIAGKTAKTAKCLGDGVDSGTLDCFNETLAKTGKDCQSPIFITSQAKDACVGLSLKEKLLALDPEAFSKCVVSSSESKKPTQAVNDCLNNTMAKSDLNTTEYESLLQNTYKKLYPSAPLPK